MIGLPELVPGRFIEITGLGKDVENQFYLQEVIHTYSGAGDYITRIIGKAATISEGGLGGLGGLGDVSGSMSDMTGSISGGLGGLF